MSCVRERPFLVVRAAGSGMEGSGDLVALRGDCSFPIEVKSTRAEKLYFSGRTKDQLNAMIREGERSGLMPLYAYRLKGVRGDSWRVFRVETETLHGKLRKLEPSIPSLPLTRNGKPYLNWEDGLPLNEFIAIVCSQVNSNGDNLKNLQIRSNSIDSYVKNEAASRNRKITNKPKRNILAELKKRKL